MTTQLPSNLIVGLLPSYSDFCVFVLHRGNSLMGMAYKGGRIVKGS